MRICLVAHSFPPLGWTGVENHCAALAAALARAGHAVEVFVPRPGPEAERSQRREVAPAGYAVTWLTLGHPPAAAADHLDRPGAARAFEEFLARERPEIVHFQHQAKLGVGLIEVAHRRGLPLVYTAHDYSPVCHRLTLLRPDLSPCSTLGDPAACARCDASAALLDRLGRLGDYQMGVLRGQLGDDEADELARTLVEEAPEGVLAERRRLDALRTAAFALVDRVLAPTRFLAERLVAGGLDAQKIAVQACGIPVDELAALAPPGAGSKSRGLRFGYVGGIAKHKGLHHLLEAFSGLRATARLAIFGDGSDRAYVEHMRAEAAAAGAAWHGRFEAQALPRVLEQIDVLVLPSVWYENAPFVIREAHAARRPVIASRIGALPESVRDGVDGLLVEPGSPSALAAAMQRLALEPELLAQLVAGCERPRSIDAQAAELVELYGELVAARRVAPPPVPAHMEVFRARHHALAELPQRELLAQVLRGLDALAHELGAPGGERRAVAPEAVDKLAERARDRRREGEWLRESLAAARAATHEIQGALAAADVARAALTAERDWLRDTQAEALSERDWLRTTFAALERQRDWLAQGHQALAAERDWLRDTLAAERERAQWLDSSARTGAVELEWLRGLRADLAGERDWLRASLMGLELERDWLRASSAAHGAAVTQLESELARLREHATAMARHERWLRGECAALVTELGAPANAMEEPAELAQALDAARGRLARLAAELEWRRGEMERARADGGAAFRHLLARSALGRRMRGWPDAPGGQAGPA